MMTDNTSPAGLDLDAITKRARRVYPKRGWDGGEAERALPVVTEDVPALVARVRDLTAKLDATAQAYDDLVAQVWTVATGSTHEGPASVDALLNTVLDMRNSRDALRYEVSTALHLPPTIGPAPGELARVMRATEEARDKALAGLCPQGYVVIPLALHDAACRLASDLPRLQREADALRESHRERSEALLTARRWADDAQRLLDAKEGTEREEELARTIWAEAEARVAAARREGAEAMREACAEVLDAHARRSETARERFSAEDDRYGEALVVSCACEDLAAALRALPLPGGES